MQTIQDNAVMVAKSTDIVSMPIPVEDSDKPGKITSARSERHSRGTAHERKTAGRRNCSLLPSLLCVRVMDDERSSSLIR